MTGEDFSSLPFFQADENQLLSWKVYRKTSSVIKMPDKKTAVVLFQTPLLVCLQSFKRHKNALCIL